MSKQDLIASLREQMEAIEAHGSSGRKPSRHDADRDLPSLESPASSGTEGSRRKGDFPNVDAARGLGWGESDHVASEASTDKAELSAEAAFKKLVALVNASDKSEHSLRARLAKAGFPESAAEEAILRGRSYGFVDDARFADLLIRSRISQGKGSAGIERELRQHGIDPATCPGWPFEYDIDPEDEIGRALALLDRKPPRSKNLRDGAYRRLVQKGFPSFVAQTAARMWAEGRLSSF